MSDGKHWFDKTMDTVKRASEAGVDLVQRNVRQASLRVDLSALRKSLELAHRDVGRLAVERLRADGKVTPDAVAHLLRRVDELEDQIASKERELADVESEQGGRPAAEPGPPPESRTESGPGAGPESGPGAGPARGPRRRPGFSGSKD